MEEKGLYKKILNVMVKVQSLEKDGLVDYTAHGKTTKYKYLSAEKVVAEVRKAMIGEGLILLPVQVSHVKQENVTTVEVMYDIVDVDTGQSHRIESIGQGSDSQDKGSNRALTGSLKYAILTTYLIPKLDDPDKISRDELDDVGKKRKIDAIMEYLNHPTFTGHITYKNQDVDLDEKKANVLSQINDISLQRLTTVHKHVTAMYEIAFEKSVNEELGDNEVDSR